MTTKSPGWRERPGSGGSTEVAEPPIDWLGAYAEQPGSEESAAGGPQPMYLMLMRLTNAGRQVVQVGPERILEINHEVEQHGCEIVAQYALLGGWDFATIIKAKDNLTIHAVARDLAAHGDLKTMTMPAIPVPEFIEEMKKGWPGAREL